MIRCTWCEYWHSKLYAKTLVLKLLASCTTPSLAEKHFKQAAAFMIQSDPTYPAGPIVNGFDFSSLMLYDSNVGKPDGQQASPLVIKNQLGPRLLMGGNTDLNLAGPSESDIERVKALYPAPPPDIDSFNLHQGRGAPPGKRSGTGNATQSTQSCPKAGASGVPVRPVPTVQPSGAPAVNRTTKRWYSVPEAQDAAVEALRPWPPGQDGRRVVTWCFEDQASSDALGTLLAWGRQSWETVLHNPEEASLYFENDPACGAPRGPCLCTTNGVSEVSLRISMGRPGQTEFDSTLGYRDPIVANPHPNRPRHWLKWPSDVFFFGEAGGLMMAHLLGEIPPLTFKAW
jgi:hypothetical protein